MVVVVLMVKVCSGVEVLRGCGGAGVVWLVEI